MKAFRVTLFPAGNSYIAVGAVFFFRDLAIAEIAGVVLWLGAALVLHDAIIVPVFSFASRQFHRVTARVPASVRVVAEAGFVVGVLLTAVVVPELIAQARGARNPTVVPGDYLARLGVVWLGIAAIVVLISSIIVLRRRTCDRSTSSR